MAHVSTTDPTFLKTVERWCRSEAEVLALVRFRCGAGSREFRLFSSVEALSEMIVGLPAGSCVTVYREHRLPLRGVVDLSFIADCVKKIPEGCEYLMTETVQTVAGKGTWFHYGSGASHAELKDDLQESLGVPVAVGCYPDISAGPDNAVDAVVPDVDGVVRAGPY